MKENTLLIVDDSPAVRTLIKNAVTENSLFSHILEAQDGMEALKLFFSNKVDFIITDIMMPKVDGYKFISAIKESEAGKDIPVIMLSAGKKGVMDKVKGLEIGASDYLIKPFDSSELLARIIVFLKMQRLQEELKEKNALLEKLSITDELTGIYNRRYFCEYMNMHMALAKRHNYQIGCIMIDVDLFKKVNDTFGHDVGDKVLKGIARLMKDKIREGEIIARFGGEEFIVGLCRVDTSGAMIAAERIRKAVEGANLSDDANNPLKMTVSIGIALYPQQGVSNLDELIKAADDALYHAKRTGRNRVVVYSESIALFKNEGGGAV